MSRRRRSTIQIVREEGLRIRSLFSRNIIILVITVVLLFFSLPFIAKFIFAELYTYAYDNIDVTGVRLEDIVGEVDIGTLVFGGTFFEQLLQILVTLVVFTILGDAYWYGTFVVRVSRFAFLSIMGFVFIFLVAFFIVSILIHLPYKEKVKFRNLLISTFFASTISLGIAFFFIISNEQIISAIGGIAQTLINSQELLFDIPLLAVDLIYNFWLGIFILAIIHIILITSFQYIFRNF